MRTLNLLFLFTLTVAGFFPEAASGITIMVDTVEDELNEDGDCSLREAILSANTNPAGGVDECAAGSIGSDTITIMVSGTASLGSQLAITEPLTIDGPGRDSLELVASPGIRHFFVSMASNSQDFSLSNLTLSNGGVTSSGGGSILVEQVGTLRLDTVRIRNALADGVDGGALSLLVPDNNNSRVEIHDSEFIDNEADAPFGGQAHGGAVFIGGPYNARGVQALDIQRSLFLGNEAQGWGGAILATGVPTVTITESRFESNRTNFGGESGGGVRWNVADSINPLMIVERSSFIANRSTRFGGAISFSGGTTSVRNATFHANVAESGSGEAISLASGAEVFVFHSTFVDNGRELPADATAYVCGTCQLGLSHSIVWASWTPEDDCKFGDGGTLVSGGYNIDGSGTCTGSATDRPFTDPELWPLDDHGDGAPGIVLPTILPAPGSVAIDGGSSSCPGPFGGSTTLDQRSEVRPVPGPSSSAALCDIGAVEYQPGQDPISRTLQVTLAGNGSGSVSSQPAGIDCPADDCSSDFPDGSIIELTATPDPGATFTGWSGACNGTDPCQVNMSSNQLVQASFTRPDGVFSDRFEQ